MHTFRFTSRLAIAMCAGALASLATPALAANLMSACEAEIAANCAGVSKGRGRISLCLFAHGDKLSGACKTEVVKVSDSRAFKRYVPAGVRSLQGSEYEAGLRKACTSSDPEVRRRARQLIDVIHFDTYFTITTDGKLLRLEIGKRRFRVRKVAQLLLAEIVSWRANRV